MYFVLNFLKEGVILVSEVFLNPEDADVNPFELLRLFWEGTTLVPFSSYQLISRIY